MFKIEALSRIKAVEGDHRWVNKVEQKVENNPDKPEFPEGFFDGEPGAIAQGLKSKSSDFKQAMSRLSFYVNRSGKNLSADDKSRLEKAKEQLRKLYKKPESKENI